MGFLSGSFSFERFWVRGFDSQQLGPDQVEVLEQHAIGQVEKAALDQARVGFLAGDHLLDLAFGLEKNVVNDALHFAIRIDTDQVPAAVRRAWLQLELAALTANNPSGRPTKAQRQEAKETVEARCEEESQTGKFRRMQQFPVLWDARGEVLYFGGSSASAIDQFLDLFARAFDLELERITSGKIARAWAADAKRLRALDDLAPSVFHRDDLSAEILWWNGHSENFDYLGNEFLLWLWRQWETESDTVALPDESEVTGMFARTLSLECPRGESGKESFSAESPVHLPEARQGLQSGKLPRKAGLTLVRQGEQYDLTLQAESFSVGAGKIQSGEERDEGDAREERIVSLRALSETLDLLFQTFCERRIGKAWPEELERLRGWLKETRRASKKPAA